MVRRHLGLGKTQMLGGFVVFNNWERTRVLVFVVLDWEKKEREGKERCHRLLTRQRAEGLVGLEVQGCGR